MNFRMLEEGHEVGIARGLLPSPSARMVTDARSALQVWRGYVQSPAKVPTRPGLAETRRSLNPERHTNSYWRSKERPNHVLRRLSFQIDCSITLSFMTLQVDTLRQRGEQRLGYGPGLINGSNGVILSCKILVASCSQIRCRV